MNALTIQFLNWVSAEQRTYAQAMDAWRSSCPRLTIWEDALAADLIRVRRDQARNVSIVTLTAKGAAMLGAVGDETAIGQRQAPMGGG